MYDEPEDVGRQAALQRLLDEGEIRDVLVRYCRGVDRRDEALVRSCYHDGATDSHGMFVGAASAFVPYALEHLETMICTQHVVANVVIEIEDDAAATEASCLAFHRMPSGEHGLADHLVGLRFVDRFERRQGSWRIARRTVVYDWSRIDPVGRQWTMEGYMRGLRSQDDPSYAAFRELRGEA